MMKQTLGYAILIFLAEVKCIFSYNLLYISVNKHPFALVIFSILLQSKMDFQSFEDKNE